MFDQDLISGDRLTQQRTSSGERLVLKLRLPWYRSLWLSCLDNADLTIDGQAVPVEEISFRLYGQTHPFADLKNISSVSWFVLDAADLLIPINDALADGPHEVSLSLFFRIPYHRGNVFRQVSKCTKTMQYDERIAA